MEQFNYSTVRISSWHEFKLYIQQFSENWVFRGQAYCEWILNNAIERTDFIKLFPDLDGYALSLKNRYNNMKSPAELDEELKQKNQDQNYSYIP